MELPTIHYLEMTGPCELRPGKEVDGFEVRLVNPPDPSLNARFYREVGADWAWTDRLVWTDDCWRGYVERDELVTGIGCIGGEPVGYFELEMQGNGHVQVQYFGLLPKWIGRGLGGALLTAALRTAWSLPGTRRVWVHTCTKDHPQALANYERRGFRKYRTEAPEMADCV